MNHIENQPITILSLTDLNITGLTLLGHAAFHKTHEALSEHSHSEIEFIAIIKGTQHYVVDDKQYSLCGGDVFMTRPNEIHSNGSFPQDVADIIWFQFDLSSPDNFLGVSSTYNRYLFDRLNHYQKRITCVSQKELKKLQNAFKLLCNKNVHQHMLGWNLFLNFIISNFCECDDDSIKIPTDTDCLDIAKAEDYICLHITDNLSLESIAKHCGMSVTKLNTAFKEQKGITPHNYIVSKKIEIAKNLLLKTNNTVTDIAFQLNFSSSDYFSSVFKKYTGYSPTQYHSQ